MWQALIIFIVLWACDSTTKTIDVSDQDVETVYADADLDGFTSDEDCDDTNPQVNPNASEICDGIDNNCNDIVDEMVTIRLYEDVDGDGFGGFNSIENCTNIEGYSPVSNDCNDNNATVYPGAIEVCDEVDNNCDGQIDEGLNVAWYLDYDNDGFGDINFPSESCTPGVGYVPNHEDCDDTTALINPNREEVCDNLDNDCDGQVDEDLTVLSFVDADGDGHGDPLQSTFVCEGTVGVSVLADDCDDTNVDVYPGAIEVCDNLDNDCDGQVDDDINIVWYMDADGDGFGNPATLLETCNPPSGYVSNASDCNDQTPLISPFAVEMCDGFDNNCDGAIDNAPVNGQDWYLDVDGDGYGTPGASINACLPPSGYVALDTDCDDLNIDIHPFHLEACDEIDNDCDGVIDEGVGTTFFLDADGDGYGTISVYVEACDLPAGYANNATDCNDTESSIHPTADELCNGFDDDCDSFIDENDAIDTTTWYADADGDGFGNSGNFVVSCTAPSSYVNVDGDCNDSRSNVHPNAIETCATAYDDNCDGDDNTENSTGCMMYFVDEDQDGYGISQGACLCSAEDEMTSLVDTDCDDTNAAVNPGLHENCATVYDDDCDGDTNEIGGSSCTFFYEDIDGDGFGTALSVCTCEEWLTFTAMDSGDCNDADASVHPDAIEICDPFDVDEDCSGVADDADAIGAITWYRDYDLDGFGDDNTQVTQCDAPTQYIDIAGDCNDGTALIAPNVQESCFTAYDDNCNQSQNDENALGCANYYLDEDADNYGTGSSICLCEPEGLVSSTNDLDCDDTSANINPSETEKCLTVNIDDDCDGLIDEENASDCDVYFYDQDGDGFGVVNMTVCTCDPFGLYTTDESGDCNDLDQTINVPAGNCGLFGNLDFSVASHEVIGGDFSEEMFDYNGDGHLDLMFADSGYDTLYNNVGRVYLYLGPFVGNFENNDQTNAEVIFIADGAPNIGLGSTISSGDFDCDGQDEVVVNSGSEYFVMDYASSSTGYIDPTQTAVASGTGRLFGIGDDNQDGCADAYCEGCSNGNLLLRGNAQLASQGFLEDIAIDLYTEPMNTRFSMRKDWDYNGDGLADFLIDAPPYSVDIDFGPLDGVPDVLGNAFTPFWSLDSATNTNPSQYLLYSPNISLINNLNSNNEAILFLGDYFTRNYFFDQYIGNYSIQYGGRIDGITYADLTQAQISGNLNNPISFLGTIEFHMLHRVADIGDINNDGFNDIIVMGRDKREGPQALLYYGPLDNPEYILDDAEGSWPNPTNSTNDRKAFSVGDINNDGYQDFFFGWYEPASNVKRRFIYLGASH